jgi:hypothetical protein
LLFTGTVQAFGPFGVAYLCVLALLVILWLRLDAEAGHPSGRVMKACAIFLPILALPVHFFRSRGAKGGVIATLGMIALVLLSLVSGALGEYAIQFLRP